MAAPVLEPVAETDSKCRLFLVDGHILRLRDNFVEMHSGAASWYVVQVLPRAANIEYWTLGGHGSSSFIFGRILKDWKPGDQQLVQKITLDNNGQFKMENNTFQSPRIYVIRERDSESFYCSNLDKSPMELWQRSSHSVVPEMVHSFWMPKGYQVTRALFASGKVYWREFTIMQGAHFLTFFCFDPRREEPPKPFPIGKFAISERELAHDRKSTPDWAFRNEMIYTVISKALYVGNTQVGFKAIPLLEYVHLIDVDQDGWVYVKSMSQISIRISKFRPDLSNPCPPFMTSPMLKTSSQYGRSESLNNDKRKLQTFKNSPANTQSSARSSRYNSNESLATEFQDIMKLQASDNQQRVENSSDSFNLRKQLNEEQRKCLELEEQLIKCRQELKDEQMRRMEEDREAEAQKSKLQEDVNNLREKIHKQESEERKRIFSLTAEHKAEMAQSVQNERAKIQQESDAEMNRLKEEIGKYRQQLKKLNEENDEMIRGCKILRKELDEEKSDNETQKNTKTTLLELYKKTENECKKLQEQLVKERNNAAGKYDEQSNGLTNETKKELRNLHKKVKDMTEQFETVEAMRKEQIRSILNSETVDEEREQNLPFLNAMSIKEDRAQKKNQSISNDHTLPMQLLPPITTRTLNNVSPSTSPRAAVLPTPPQVPPRTVQPRISPTLTTQYPRPPSRTHAAQSSPYIYPPSQYSPNAPDRSPLDNRVSPNGAVAPPLPQNIQYRYPAYNGLQKVNGNGMPPGPPSNNTFRPY